MLLEIERMPLPVAAVGDAGGQQILSQSHAQWRMQLAAVLGRKLKSVWFYSLEMKVTIWIAVIPVEVELLEVDLAPLSERSWHPTPPSFGHVVPLPFETPSI